MIRIYTLLCLSIFFPAMASATVSRDLISANSAPNSDTPREVADAWLRFHELELCQGMDAVFSFTKDGVQVRTLVEDEKSYQKFEELMKPLSASFKVELSATRIPEDKTPDSDREPPPSLWENYELRSFMGDPYAQARERFESEGDMPPTPPADGLLKHRLLIYAEQTLDWNRKIESYAKELPVLTRVALDPKLPPELRRKANALCMAHAQNMEKYIGKLSASLEPAFPSADKKERSAFSENPGLRLKTPTDRADYVHDFAGTVSKRVHQFIHPEQYSVDLHELRQPGVLESLKALRKADSEFRKSLAKAKP